MCILPLQAPFAAFQPPRERERESKQISLGLKRKFLKGILLAPVSSLEAQSPLDEHGKEPTEITLSWEGGVGFSIKACIGMQWGGCW